VSLNGIGETDQLRKLQQRILSKEVIKEQKLQIETNRDKRNQEKKINLRIERAHIRDVAREEAT
jgi:hypothetical protein